MNPASIQQKEEMTTKFAKQRLFRDWKELEQEKSSLRTVSAMPTSNIFIWHCNLRPEEGPYTGCIFHVILRFPSNYPHEPPKVQLCSELKHPNVFWGGGSSNYWICLDMIQSYYNSTPYRGWTSAYSILSLLLQLQSFLFAENIEQDYGGTAEMQTGVTAVRKTVAAAQQYASPQLKAHDGTVVMHTYTNPWPPLPEMAWDNAGSQRPNKQVLPKPPRFETNSLPTDVYLQIFSYLDTKDLLQSQRACRHWNQVISAYNVLERSQIMCFHTKAKVDDGDTVLGVGIQVEYYRGGPNLKLATSPLDLLSLHAFDDQNVRRGVWGAEKFDHFLPLVLNAEHGERAVLRMEQTIFEVMKHCELPQYHKNAEKNYRERRNRTATRRNNKDSSPISHDRFHALMAFQLLATLMNSMVVELMDSAEQASAVSRHASEKALEGYCAFHHLLLFFAKRYPIIAAFAEQQVQRFLSGYYFRHKAQVPNLGILLVCLTLSKTGWDTIRKPFVMEAFDRNVHWLLQKYPDLAKDSISDKDRLEMTFDGARTSRRLLMFQSYFLNTIGRPRGGPSIALSQYNRQMGKPTPKQKRNLQQQAKEILEVTSWPRFFARIGGPVPSSTRLVEILVAAVQNSTRKKYHDPDQARKMEEARQRRAREARQRHEQQVRQRHEQQVRHRRDRQRREQEQERQAQLSLEEWRRQEDFRVRERREREERERERLTAQGDLTLGDLFADLGL